MGWKLVWTGRVLLARRVGLDGDDVEVSSYYVFFCPEKSRARESRLWSAPSAQRRFAVPGWVSLHLVVFLEAVWGLWDEKQGKRVLAVFFWKIHGRKS